jgi:hypothetical protein
MIGPMMKKMISNTTKCMISMMMMMMMAFPALVVATTIVLERWKVLEIRDELSPVTVRHFDPSTGTRYQELKDND